LSQFRERRKFSSKRFEEIVVALVPGTIRQFCIPEPHAEWKLIWRSDIKASCSRW